MICTIPGLISSFTRNINTQQFTEKHHKSQHFVFRNGMRIEEESVDKTPKISRAESLLVGNDVFRRGNVPNLTFTASYYEKLGEEEKSTTRFRKCNIIYFLENDEFKIFEPPMKNSGLCQGCIVGRNKLRKADGSYYTIDDLNIGNTLVVNGREYTLINCDVFTKNFLTNMGFRVNSPQPDVYDPITEDRNEMNTPRSYRKPRVKNYKLATFFKYHPKQLRFYGYYGQDKNLFEEKKKVTLYYDLSNGFIKIIEGKNEQEFGDKISSTRVVLRPTLVPQKVESFLSIGEMGDPTLLNLAHDFQTVLIGGQYYNIRNPSSGLVDSNPLHVRERNIEYYKDVDLDLGKPLNIFGSTVTLHDCDEFTKNYYHATYNKELVPIPWPEEKSHQSHKLVYEHEEFGDPEQALRDNDPFLPIQHNVDLVKFFKNDRHGYDVKELKFLACIVTEDSVETIQRSIVSFFLEDDTMRIRDLDFSSQHDSTMEHNHLKRMKVSKPQSVYENSGRCFYQAIDMFVGNVLYIRGKAYKLLEADEYTYDYMERNCHKFMVSNIRKIMADLREWVRTKCGSLKQWFEDKDPGRTGWVTYENFRVAIYAEMPADVKGLFPEHVIKTVARYYAKDKYIGMRFGNLVAMMRTELYRKNFYCFGDLKIAFQKHDIEKRELLDADRIYYVLRSTSIPVSRDLLKSFIYKFPKSNDKINYNVLLKTIDWINNPSPDDKANPYEPIPINWEGIETEKNLDKIRYNCFMMDALL